VVPKNWSEMLTGKFGALMPPQRENRLAAQAALC
jgi:hypothetical protein